MCRHRTMTFGKCRKRTNSFDAVLLCYCFKMHLIAYRSVDLDGVLNRWLGEIVWLRCYRRQRLSGRDLDFVCILSYRRPKQDEHKLSGFGLDLLWKHTDHCLCLWQWYHSGGEVSNCFNSGLDWWQNFIKEWCAGNK